MRAIFPFSRILRLYGIIEEKMETTVWGLGFGVYIVPLK